MARKVRDQRLLTLIGRYLRAGVMVEGVLQARTKEPARRSRVSLLANILLDDLDKELERRGLPFVRYADDFVIFTRSRRAAERVFRSVNRYLTQHLRLVVNETKSRIVEADGVEYLGFVFRGRRATINVSEKNIQKFKHRIRELTGRSRGISMERRMSELRSYSRLDGLLRLGRAVETVRQTRPVDTTPVADVLLEALAICTHAPTGTHSARRPATASDPPRPQSERPLAHGQVHCHGCRSDERLAANTRTTQPEDSLGQLAPLRRTA